MLHKHGAALLLFNMCPHTNRKKSSKKSAKLSTLADSLSVQPSSCVSECSLSRERSGNLINSSATCPPIKTGLRVRKENFASRLRSRYVTSVCLSATAAVSFVFYMVCAAACCRANQFLGH
uniref:(northern house mosquito) hypothetical protein n=1 Tax=Culex pipiens TaxID=7175 RepID=A0A8D8G6M1_CULPI